MQDADSDLTFALNGFVENNVLLSGGKIILSEDLIFKKDYMLQGPGIVELANNRLLIGTKNSTASTSLYFDGSEQSVVDINSNISLASTWTFSGCCVLDCNGYAIYLENNGELVVEAGSSLHIKDAIIDGISTNNIRCLDDNAQITLQNVNWQQDGNYSFTQGAIVFDEYVKMIGEYTFAYQTNMTSTICEKSELVLDEGFTFSYDPIISSQSLLEFAADNSILSLKGGTIYASDTGLQMKTGLMNIKQDSFFVSRDSTGIILGNSLSEDDFVVNFFPGVTLTVSFGALHYKNVDEMLLVMKKGNILSFSVDTTLGLYENMDIGDGLVRFYQGSRLATSSNIELTGAMSIKGELYEISLVE